VSPAVYSVRRQRVALSGIRLVLAVLGLVGSILAGADAAAAGVGAALGAAVCGLALLTDRRWLLFRAPSAASLPEDARRAPLGRVVLGGMVPSTAGVAILAAVSLAFEPLLGAVLAGVLGGMGLVSLASWAEVVLWERRAGVTLFADADVHTRRYVVPAQPPEARPEPEPSASTAAHAPGGSRGK
jgi:hypothetical protein